MLLGGLLGHQKYEHDIDLATIRAAVVQRLLQCYQAAGRYSALRYAAMGYGDALANRCATEFFPIEQRLINDLASES